MVKHPGNTSLDGTIEDYRHLIGGNAKFSAFTSDEVIDAAEREGDADYRHIPHEVTQAVERPPI